MTCEWCGVERDAPAMGPHVCLPERVFAHTLQLAVRVCDRLALGRPDNRMADNPRAAYQSGAAKCAWELRQLIRQVKPAPTQCRWCGQTPCDGGLPGEQCPPQGK